MAATLETLELTPQELEACKDAVQRMAYFNWLDAGCQHGKELDDWVQAEMAWIENSYVPHRAFDGTRPQSVEKHTSVSEATSRREPAAPRLA